MIFFSAVWALLVTLAKGAKYEVSQIAADGSVTAGGTSELKEDGRPAKIVALDDLFDLLEPEFYVIATKQPGSVVQVGDRIVGMMVKESTQESKRHIESLQQISDALKRCSVTHRCVHFISSSFSDRSLDALRSLDQVGPDDVFIIYETMEHADQFIRFWKALSKASVDDDFSDDVVDAIVCNVLKSNRKRSFVEDVATSVIDGIGLTFRQYMLKKVQFQKRFPKFMNLIGVSMKFRGDEDPDSPAPKSEATKDYVSARRGAG